MDRTGLPAGPGPSLRGWIESAGMKPDLRSRAAAARRQARSLRVEARLLRERSWDLARRRLDALAEEFMAHAVV